MQIKLIQFPSLSKLMTLMKEVLNIKILTLRNKLQINNNTSVKIVMVQVLGVPLICQLSPLYGSSSGC